MTMNYTENFEGIKMDVQAVDITLSDKLQQSIRKMITRLRMHFSEINWIDIYFRKNSSHAESNRKLSVRLGIPGNDAFASDSGDNWKSLLKKVEGKLRRQRIKRLN